MVVQYKATPWYDFYKQYKHYIARIVGLSNIEPFAQKSHRNNPPSLSQLPRAPKLQARARCWMCSHQIPWRWMFFDALGCPPKNSGLSKESVRGFQGNPGWWWSKSIERVESWIPYLSRSRLLRSLAHGCFFYHRGFGQKILRVSQNTYFFVYSCKMSLFF